MSAREQAPEKALMRDYVDSRFNLGEFLLPSVVVLLAVTILGSYWPQRHASSPRWRCTCSSSAVFLDGA